MRGGGIDWAYMHNHSVWLCLYLCACFCNRHLHFGWLSEVCGQREYYYAVIKAVDWYNGLIHNYKTRVTCLHVMMQIINTSINSNRLAVVLVCTLSVHLFVHPFTQAVVFFLFVCLLSQSLSLSLCRSLETEGKWYHSNDYPLLLSPTLSLFSVNEWKWYLSLMISVNNRPLYKVFL